MTKTKTKTNKYFPTVGDWTEAEKKKPLSFDLVKMRLDDGLIVNGWWEGNLWESRKPLEGKVVAWKRIDARYEDK